MKSSLLRFSLYFCIMNALFQSNSIVLDLPDAAIIYYPDFINAQESNLMFEKLLKETPWKQDEITVYGKKHLQPRLTSLYGEEDKSYSYSNIKMMPNAWTPLLQKLKSKIENICDVNFNVVLLNYYRNEKDGNGWHADNEKELGKNPTIASLSFGANRSFQLKHNQDKTIKRSIILEHGSLLVMKGTTQECYKHQIPKSSKLIGPRINLTFRTIK